MRGVDAVANILPCGGSDHWPVILMIQLVGTPKNRSFRFEAFSSKHPAFMDNIKGWWEEYIPINVEIPCRF